MSIMTDVLTLAEAAEYLKVDQSTVVKLAKRGQLPAVRLGRLWRFWFEHIEKIDIDAILKLQKPPRRKIHPSLYESGLVGFHGARRILKRSHSSLETLVRIGAAEKHPWREKGIAFNRSEIKKLAESFRECSICHCTDRPLVIDHDHATGKFRDGLCGKCNSALGFFMDSPELCESAAAYLRSHGK